MEVVQEDPNEDSGQKPAEEIPKKTGKGRKSKQFLFFY